MLEIEHIMFDERISDLLVRPRNEHLIVIRGLFGQAGRKVDGTFQVHAFPVGLQQNAQLLGTAEGECRNENFTYGGIFHGRTTQRLDF